MKRMIRLLAMCMVLITVFSFSTIAADVYDINTNKDVISDSKFVPQTSANANVKPQTVEVDGDVQMMFPGTDKISFTYTPVVNAEQQVVFLLKKDSLNSTEKVVPTASNIYYINQTANEGAVTFDVYPSELDNGEYGIYVAAASLSGMEEVGNLKVASEWTIADFTLGNVDMDAKNVVNIADAMLFLNFAAKNVTLTDIQKKAGNVNFDNAYNIADAMIILNFAAKNINTF